MAIEVKYETEATAWGGREGRAATADGKLDLGLSMPVALGGSGGEGTNPEQLFSLGYAACFHSALKLVAGQAGVDVSESAITCTVAIGRDSADGGFGLAVQLAAELPGVDGETARALLARAHEVCPYSKATRSNIEVTLEVI
jgi:lipoyl-dependent peroxiredoxin